MKVKVLNAQTQIEVRIIDLQDFLARSGECLMGRSPSSGLVLESSDVSRLHGKFVSEQGQYYFYDLGSANGSLVNGAIAQANHGYLLHSGDIVRIGEYVLMMQASNNLEDLPATVIGDPNATVVGGLAFGAMISGFAAAEERIPEPVELVGVVSDEIFAEPDRGLEDLTDSLEFDEDGIEDAIADQPVDEVIEDAAENEFIEDKIADEAIEEEFVNELLEDEPVNDEFVEEETIDEAIDYEFAGDRVIENETVDELTDDETIDELEEETIDEFADESIDNKIVDHATVDELEDADDENIVIDEPVDEVIEEREYEEATVTQEISSSVSSETQPEIQSETLDPSEVIAVLPDPWNDPSVVPSATSDALAGFPLDSPVLESEPTVIPTNDSLSIPSTAEIEDLSDTTVIQPDDLVDIEPPEDGTVIQLTDLVDEPSVVPQQVPSSSLTELAEVDAIAEEQEEEQESVAIAPSSEPEDNQITHEIDHEIDTIIDQFFDSEPPTIPGITLPTTNISAFEEEELDEELEESVSLIDLPLETEEELTEPEEELPKLETNTQVTPSTASIEPAHSEILSTVQKKYIVLLAHENQEAELIQLIESYQSFLSQCQILTTPTLSDTLKRQIGFTVTQQTPALLQGGYQSVNSLITAGKILAVLFARDFLTPQQTQSNDDALSRSCNVYGVLFASNLPTAEALLHSLQTKVTAAQ